MKAAIFKGKGAIALDERADPTIKELTDAVVRVVLACVCGSDLWFYRGQTDYPIGSPVGHEFLGVVEDVEALNNEIDATYQAKYSRYSTTYVDPMIAPQGRATTLKLVPSE